MPVPGSDPLLVVIVREAAIGSTLVARLAMSGADTCTAQSFDERRPAMGGMAGAVLITDQAAVDGHPGGITALLGDPQWRGVVVLSADAIADDTNPRLRHLEPGQALAAMPQLIAEWR